ncbi:MAG: hypothetical protein Kow00109_20450 [Acidobacteriota bacterium]
MEERAGKLQEDRDGAHHAPFGKVFHRVARRPLGFLAILWFASTFVAGPLDPRSASPEWHWKVGPIFLGRPVVTWGDSPHYLALVNSLIEDADFDLANNYRQAEQGDWDLGTRLRGKPVDHHTDIDASGRELLFHPWFMPLVIAACTWPLAHSQWVESAAIWITMAVVLLGVSAMKRWVPGKGPALWWAGLATPLWCYSRDPWSESWLFAAWSGMLATRSLPLLGVLAVAGVLTKYSFAVVPAALGLTAAWRREWIRAGVLVGGTGFALLLGIAVSQYLFAETDHFSLFHMGAHRFKTVTFSVAPFGLNWRALPGLLFDWRDGLLPFFPVLAWGLWSFRRGGDLYLPAVAFLLLHAGYLGWRAGSGFGARYLVPMVGVLVAGTAQSKGRPRLLFWTALAWSACFGILGGCLPAAVYDRTPGEILRFVGEEIRLWWLGA